MDPLPETSSLINSSDSLLQSITVSVHSTFFLSSPFQLPFLSESSPSRAAPPRPPAPPPPPSSAPRLPFIRFSSPFKTKKTIAAALPPPPLTTSGMTSFECSLLDGGSDVSGDGLVGGGGGGGLGDISREELLQLYVMKLDEEANYFKATSPVEEEFCNCPKCQVSEVCCCIAVARAACLRRARLRPQRCNSGSP